MPASPLPDPQLKRRQRMEYVDSMQPELRALVHEYGLSIVQAFLDLGIRKPKHIRHLVETVRAGSYQTRSDGLDMRRALQARNTQG